MKRKHSRNPIVLPAKIPKLDSETKKPKKQKKKLHKTDIQKNSMFHSERSTMEIDSQNENKILLDSTVSKGNVTEKSPQKFMNRKIQSKVQKCNKEKVTEHKKRDVTLSLSMSQLETNLGGRKITVPANPRTEYKKPNAGILIKNRKSIKHSRKMMDVSKSKMKRSKKSKVKSPDVLMKKEKIEAISAPIQKPSNPEDFSSNWKKLSQTLPAKHRKKKNTKKFPKKIEVKTEMKNKVEAAAEDKKPAQIWFDDVDEILIEPQELRKDKTFEASDKTTISLVEPDSYKGITKVVAMDCEMVGVGDGQESILARVSLVNQYGQCIYDTFVKPTEEVVDYRTRVSGVRKEDMEKGEEFSKVQKDIYNILKGRILVGHALENDFKVLYFGHPRKMTRDTSRYKPFIQLFKGAKPSLKKLSAQLLNVSVQEGEHNSIQDAQATMRLYTLHRKQWEKTFTMKKYGKRNFEHKKDVKKSSGVS